MPNSVFKEEPAKEKGRDNLFLWTVFLLFLAALVFACWLGSFYIFGHPEQPKAYRILQKLGKLAPPARFVVTKAPPGEFLEAQRVYERYSKYTALQMQRENELLFRCYLKNFTETKKTVPYLTGKFVILRAYELQRGDLLNSGVVVLTQAVDFPQLLAEVVYPAPKESVPDILALLQPGLEIRLQRTLDLSAIVQISHALEGRLQVSVFPLLYGSYALKNGVGSFSLEPPSSLNVAAGFPLVRGEEVRSVMRENLRRKAVAKGSPSSAPEQAGEIVRVDAPALAGGGDLAAADATAGASGKKPANQDGTLASSAPSAVLAPQSGSGEDQRTASNTDGAPGRAAPSKPEDIAGVEAVPKAEAVVRAEPVSKGEVAQKTESASKLEPSKEAPAGKPASVAKVDAIKGGNPAWMSRVVTSSGTLVVADRVEQKGGAVTAEGLAAKNGRPSSAAAVAQPTAQQFASNTAVQSKEPSKEQPKAIAKAPLPAPLAPVPSAGAGAPAGSPANAGAAKPFLAASPAPSTTQATGTWKTYSGGRTPAGKSVTPEQATTLQGRNDGAPVYLHGRFTVTAAGTNRAVLRQAGGGDGKLQPRVIVEYPAGAVPPQQGASVAREDGHGFEIREVRRTPDGQVNIFVREVSAP